MATYTPGAVNGAMYYNPATGGVETNVAPTGPQTNWQPFTEATGAPTSPAYDSGPSQQQIYAQQQASAAAQAEAQRIATLRQQAGLGQENAVGTANSGANAYRDSYRLQNQGVVNNWRSGVNSFNRGRENTALNLRRGIAGVTSGVRQGLQGAMTQLPDSALDSGATGALARSWNKQGQQQASGVYNEAALANRGLDFDFAETQRVRDEANNNLYADRQSKVGAISDQLYNELRTIDANAAAQGATGAVNLGLRDSVISRAIAELNAIDQDRNAWVGSINPLTGEQVTANAAQLDQAGAQAYSPFTLPTEEGMPVDTDSPVSQLPFYVRRRDF